MGKGNDIDYMLLGKRIMKERKKKKMSQSSLAEKIEKSRQYISSVENGKGSVGLATLIQIARELNVSVDYLLSGNSPKSQSYLRNDMQDELDKCTSKQQRAIIELFFNYG